MASLPQIPQQQTLGKNDDKLTSSNPLSSAPGLEPTTTAHPNPILTTTATAQDGLSATQAPHLRTPLASEPADQWASSTLSAVSGEQTGNIPSTVSTPGPNIPGAFPSNLPLPSKETVQADVAYVKDVAVSALTTAKDYIVAGGQKLYPYVNAAGQTVYSSTQSAGQQAAEGATVAGQKATETAAAVPSAVSSGAQAAGNTVSSGAATARDTMASGATAAKDTVVGGASAVGQTVSGGASSVGQTVYSIAEAAGGKVAPYLPSTVASYLPQRVENNTDHIQPSTAITDPTGNMKNGLEALDGTSFAKLPEEAKLERENKNNENTTSTTIFSTNNPDNGLGAVSGVDVARLPEETKADDASKPDQTAKIPFGEEMKNQDFSKSYLNPNLVMAPEPSVKPTALPPRNVPEDGPSTHQPHGGVDGDASTKTLPGSLLAGVGSREHDKKTEAEPRHEHRGTFENKPLHEGDRKQGSGDSHLETLRDHDAAAKSAKPNPKDTIVDSVKGKEEKYHGNLEKGIGHEPTVTKGPAEEAQGTGANKPVNAGAREHALGAPGSAFQQQQGPPVPEKTHHTVRGDSTTAHTGHTSTSSYDPPKVAIDQHSTSTAKDRASGGSFGSEGSNGEKKKVGFMSKMKGEMKVLSGKMTGKEEKVEEGRRIMGKN